jgi:hypothetical protein
VKPSARAAAVRGDDYQYAIGWKEAARALAEPHITSISIEDAGAGSFDDVAVRGSGPRPDRYLQVKSSNAGKVSIDEDWLTTPATAKGLSPLQHFHRTWTQLQAQLLAERRPFELTLLTNRGFDNTHPLLGAGRDNYHGQVRTEEVRRAGSTSLMGQARDAWAAHLGVDVEELLNFLAVVRWEQAGAESSWRDDAKALMRLAGLRDDDEAVEIGIAMVRELVKTGAGPQTPDQLRVAVRDRNLLASEARVILAVHAIDRPASPDVAHVTLDWVDQFPGPDAWSRYHPSDPAAWTDTFPSDLARARTSLELYRARHAFITGAMRLSTFFAVGRELADVRRWVLSLDQHGRTWTTGASAQADVTPSILLDEEVDQGEGLAVALALSNDLAEDVVDFIREETLPVRRVLALSPGAGVDPGPQAVPSDAWLMGWTRNVRDTVRRASRPADRVHLFMSAPAAAALMLGHQWNAMPAPTTVYDFDKRRYYPTYHLR